MRTVSDALKGLMSRIQPAGRELQAAWRVLKFEYLADSTSEQVCGGDSRFQQLFAAPGQLLKWKRLGGAA